MNDTGDFCGNEAFRYASTQYIYQREGALMIVGDVPTMICTYCGEKYYDIKTLKQIERRFNAIYKEGQLPIRKLTVPLESWNALKQAS